MQPTLAKASDTSTGCSTERHIAAMRLPSLDAGARTGAVGALLLAGRPEQGKMEPLGAADIAVEDFTGMQPEIHVGDRQALARAPLVECRHFAARGHRGAERARAGVRPVGGGDTGENAVAIYLEHVAVLLVDL